MVEPVNVCFETTLIAAQERADRGDMAGANALLDERRSRIECQRGADPPSLQARQAVCDLFGRPGSGDLAGRSLAYRATLTPVEALDSICTRQRRFHLPLTSYWQEIVRLDVADDGQAPQA